MKRWTIQTLWGAILLCLLDPPGSAARAQSLSQELEGIRNFYAAIKSVHVKARAEISRTIVSEHAPPEFLSGVGAIEYWEAGNLYRRDTRTSPQLRLVADMDVAYDGSLMQIMQYMTSERTPEERVSLMQLSSSGREPVPSTVPNPLFLPIDFMKLSIQHCPDCQPGLWELRDPIFWSKATTDAQVSVSPTGEMAIDLPTGSFFGTTFTYAIERAAGAPLPHRIRYRATGRDDLLSIVMSEERPFLVNGRRVSFPTRFKINSPPGEGWTGGTFDIVLEELEINHDIDPTIFKLDQSAADVIQDLNTQTYLKTRAPR
jgi:hypothetical protein